MLTSASLRRNQLSSCTARGRGVSTLAWQLYRKRGSADQAVTVGSLSQQVAVLYGLSLSKLHRPIAPSQQKSKPMVWMRKVHMWLVEGVNPPRHEH